MGSRQIDIAKIAGVSRQTVSLAINHPEKLDPQTLERVNQAIKQGAYVPDAVARNFLQRKSRTIGFVFKVYSDQEFENPFFFETLRGLHEAAMERNYAVRIYPYSEAIDLEGLFAGRHVDGIIFTSYIRQIHEYKLLELRQKSRPFVIFSEAGDFNSVDMNNGVGLELAVEKLRQRGRRHLVYVGGGLDMEFNRNKFQGFVNGMRKQNLPFREDMVFHGTYRMEEGEQIIETLRGRQIPFDGILVAVNDFVAIGCLHALLRAGFRVPDDVSLLGGDGSRYAECSEPALSALYAPYYERAKKAFELLLEVMENPERPPEQVLLPMEFRDRNTL